MKHLDYPKITTNDDIVDHENSVKFLGSCIDEKLKWDVHMQHACKNISRSIEMLHTYMDTRCFLNPSNL